MSESSLTGMHLSLPEYYIHDKQKAALVYVTDMLNKTNRLFDFGYMPASMPTYQFILELQRQGSLVIAQFDRSDFVREPYVVPPKPPDIHSNELIERARLVGGNPTQDGQPDESSLASTQQVPDGQPDANGEIDEGQVETQQGITVPQYDYDRTNLYFFRTAFTEAPNVYYMAPKVIITNPLLKESHERTIGKDCVLVRNDTLMLGLLPVFQRYAKLLLEGDISLLNALWISRQHAIVTASKDSDVKAGQKYIADIIAGKMGAYMDTAFVDGIQPKNTGAHNPQNLTGLLEFHQYLMASWYNEFGLMSSLYNTRREYVSKDEIQSSTDILLPRIDDMYVCLQRGIDEMNAIFGTKTLVQKASAWESKQEENDTRNPDVDHTRNGEVEEGQVEQSV